VPSEYLTENELAAAAIADQRKLFNPQQQFPVTWPAEPVVARAYIDQLVRDEVLSASVVDDLNTALDRSASQLEASKRDRTLAATLESLAETVGEDGGDANTMKRRAGLAETLGGIAARLR